MTAFPQPNDLTSSFDATWDAWDRMVKLEDGPNTVAEYGYDGMSRRIIKKVYDSGSLSETRHCYYSTGSQVLEERIDSDTDPAQQFLWGIRFVDDLVLRDKDTTSNGILNERMYGLSDQRFSLLAITDETGAVQERYAYDGYGRSDVFTPSYRVRANSLFGWEFRYTGRRLDLETGVYYFRARYYHAELGRFISRDPIGYVDGMSLYRGYFVPGKIDPYGLVCISCFCAHERSPGTGRTYWWVETTDLNSTDGNCKKACKATWAGQHLGLGNWYTGKWKKCDAKPDNPGPSNTCPDDWRNTSNMLDCVGCCLKATEVVTIVERGVQCYTVARPLKPLRPNGTIDTFGTSARRWRFSWRVNCTEHRLTKPYIKCGIPRETISRLNRYCIYYTIVEGFVDWGRIGYCTETCRRKFANCGASQ